jgi:hypothetical protein
MVLHIPFSEIKGSAYPVTVYVDGDGSNCKLSYIHGSGVLAPLDDESKKFVMTELLKQCKGAVIINTIHEKVTDFISKNYPTYYYHKVPIGYTTGNFLYQYHICIKNTVNAHYACREPEKVEETIDKTIIKAKLLKVLKANKRKTDYVNDFIKSL